MTDSDDDDEENRPEGTEFDRERHRELREAAFRRYRRRARAE